MPDIMFKKNDDITLTIEDLSDDGSGIGKSDGFIFFVKNTLPGDAIRAKVMKVTKSYGFARLEEIITPSSGRLVKTGNPMPDFSRAIPIA